MRTEKTLKSYYVKCTLEDGDYFYTRIKGASAEEVAKFYMFRYLNMGTVGDCFKKCVKVEFFY